MGDYKGGRSLSDLQKFAKENLKPVCSPANLDLCDADKKKQIEEFMAMGADALDLRSRRRKPKTKRSRQPSRQKSRSCKRRTRSSRRTKTKALRLSRNLDLA